METWKPVPGYDGYYEVSDQGRVRNAKTGYLLKPTPTTHGYLHVCLYMAGVKKMVRLHKMVATAFHGPVPAGHNIDHDDTNKTNNCASNLKFKTFQENSLHAVAKGCYSGNRVRLSPSCREKIKNLVEQGKSNDEIVAIIGGHRRTIERHVKRTPEQIAELLKRVPKK